MVNIAKVGNLGFGGAGLTNIRSYTVVKQLLETAFEHGIRHYDTAPLYGRGYSEVIYGKFLRGRRKEITICTKFGLGEDYETRSLPLSLLLQLNFYAKKIKSVSSDHVKNETLPSYMTAREIDKDSVVKSFETSLKRLNTDYIDYYLLHEGLPGYLTQEALEYVLNLKRSGAVRFLGIGSSISLIGRLNSTDLDQKWDILQYEGGMNNGSLKLLGKFSEKTHFYHSCVKHLEIGAEGCELKDRAGFVLARCVMANPKGKVIFSTQKVEHLKANVESFIKYKQ